MNRRGSIPPCLFVLLAALVLIVGMVILASSQDIATNKYSRWADVKITGAAGLPTGQYTAIAEGNAIYFLEANKSDKTSGRALYDGLKMGEVNKVHIATWMRRQNGRWLYVIDQMADSAPPPAESGAKPVVEESAR